jgi:hypothetical protein
MLRFIETTPHAIGYVLDCQVDERVEVVLRLPLVESDPRLDALCADKRLPRTE